MTIWRPGMKCVCIKQAINPKAWGYGDEIWPVKGEVYTVREIYEAPNGDVGLRLCEIRNKVALYANEYGEPPFHADGFRPLVSKGKGTERVVKELKRLVADPKVPAADPRQPEGVV